MDKPHYEPALEAYQQRTFNITIEGDGPFRGRYTVYKSTERGAARGLTQTARVLLDTRHDTAGAASEEARAAAKKAIDSGEA